MTAREIPKFTLVVTQADAELGAYELGSGMLENLANTLPDRVENQELFHALAQSPSSNVRGCISRNDNLRPDTMELLANDPVANVRRGLLRSKAFEEWAETKTLLAFIEADVECARDIAGCPKSFQNADFEVLAEVLLLHSDPDVRVVLAGTYDARKKHLAVLASDSDPTVASEARQALARS